MRDHFLGVTKMVAGYSVVCSGGGARNKWENLKRCINMIEITLLISIISVSFSIFFGLKNNKKSDVKDLEARIARDTRTDMKLDEIGNDVKEVKETVKNIQNDVKDHEGRITKLEASYKAEHKRLDDVFDRINKKEIAEHEQ